VFHFPQIRTCIEEVELEYLKRDAERAAEDVQFAADKATRAGKDAVTAAESAQRTQFEAEEAIQKAAPGASRQVHEAARRAADHARRDLDTAIRFGLNAKKAEEDTRRCVDEAFVAGDTVVKRGGVDVTEDRVSNGRTSILVAGQGVRAVEAVLGKSLDGTDGKGGVAMDVDESLIFGEFGETRSRPSMPAPPVRRLTQKRKLLKSARALLDTLPTDAKALSEKRTFRQWEVKGWKLWEKHGMVWQEVKKRMMRSLPRKQFAVERVGYANGYVTLTDYLNKLADVTVIQNLLTMLERYPHFSTRWYVP